LTTLREVFSSSIRQSLHGMISILMILRHDVIIKNELQQNMTKQNRILETVRVQVQCIILCIFGENQ
jgi:hypothetical protein